MMKRAHFTIKGRVQGVCYRMCARDEALRLGLSGWVSNLPNGDVELAVEGEDKQLGEFFAWCSQGPSYARVTGVCESYSEATGEFDGFEIKY